jgi:hypothetical protein
MLAPLPPDASPEAKAARKTYVDSLQGTPKTPQDYGFTKPKDMPPNLVWNQPAMDKAAEIFHRGSVPATVAKELIQLQQETIKAEAAAVEQRVTQYWQAQDKQIRETCAKENVPYEKALDLATRAARTWGMDPATYPYFKDATTFMLLVRAGQAISEDKLVSGDKGDESFGASDWAKAQSIVHDKSNPEYEIYHSANHPQKQQVIARVRALQASAFKKGQVK